MFKTVMDVVSTPMGTARLVEGFCALNRCAEAGMTVAQMKVVYPDLRQYSDGWVEGFVGVGQALLAGEARFKASAFDGAAPKPA